MLLPFIDQNLKLHLYKQMYVYVFITDTTAAYHQVRKEKFGLLKTFLANPLIRQKRNLHNLELIPQFFCAVSIHKPGMNGKTGMKYVSVPSVRCGRVFDGVATLTATTISARP